MLNNVNAGAATVFIAIFVGRKLPYVNRNSFRTISFCAIGALLALVVLALAKAFDGVDGHVMKSVAFLAGVVGFVAVAVALVDMLGELWSPAVAGASLAEVVVPFLWAAAACGVIGVACLGAASFGKSILVPAGVGAVASLVGIFLVRFAFYAVWMSIGL